MRRLSLMMIAVAVAAGPLAGQEPAPGDSARTEELRREVETRFAARVQQELGLTDEQTIKMQRIVGAQFRKRREMEMEERRLREAVSSELRPGIAADQPRLGRLLDQMGDLRVRYAQSFKEESRELAGFLTPVQRAQYFMMRERLFDRVREAQRVRGRPGPGGPLDRP